MEQKVLAALYFSVDLKFGLIEMDQKVLAALYLGGDLKYMIEPQRPSQIYE